MEVGKTDKDSQLSKRAYIPFVYGYGAGLQLEVGSEIGHALVDRSGANGTQPHITLALVDHVVQYIEANHNKSPSYWGAKFTKEYCFDDIPWRGPQGEMVFAKNRKAFYIYTVLREFYYLLMRPEYGTSHYCVSINAARQALFTVYPEGLQELPPTEYSFAENVAELEARKVVTKLVWPAAERFNLVIDKIAEIVSGSGYRSNIAREKAKLKQRAISVTNLIRGLLDYHKSLTVVAVRLSIRQEHGREFIGDKMHKALNRLIGDRRNDVLLNQTVGYFWVLQESFRAHLGQSSTTSKKQNVSGDIALHYDLVMFFDATRYHETEAISRHIGECWKSITDMAGFYRLLSGKTFSPHFSRWAQRRMKENGEFPPEAEIVGLVKVGSIQASNLQIAAKLMVASVVLRKPKNRAGTLIKGEARRFGKSDLLTGCGFDKSGRGNKLAHSGVKTQRRKRPKYVAP
jgi:hypothetical protein